MNIFIKKRFFTTKKDGTTGPTALESDGPYFEIMGQWSGPTINLSADITVNSQKTHIPLREETWSTENHMTVKTNNIIKIFQSVRVLERSRFPL